MIIDDLVSMEVPRTEARDTVDDRLKSASQAMQIKRGIKPEPEPFVFSSSMEQMGIHIHPKQEPK